MESSAQERPGMCPEKGWKNDPRDGMHLYEDRLKAGAVQPAEQKALRRPGCGILVSKGRL